MNGKAHALIIGAGPAGMAAAVCLRRQGVGYRWVDRSGRFGGAYRRMYGGIQLASPARYSGLPESPLEGNGEYVTALEYGDYLERYAARQTLHGPEKANVERIEREPEGFRADFSGGQGSGRYRAVVVATGMFDHPYRPAIAGLEEKGAGPEVLHACDWSGPERFQGRKILIIGRGMTAVEIAEECANRGLTIAMSARGGHIRTFPQRILGRDLHDYAVVLERLPVWLFGGYCRKQPTFPGTDLGFWRLVREGLIRILPEVERFEGRRAAFRGGPTQEFDVVILATGYRFETPFLPPEVARTPGGYPAAAQGESVSWPDLYFMGFPCSRGLDSQFLRGMAHDAPVVALKIKERLN